MKNKFEELGGTYREENGIFYPDLALPKQTNHPIGKYGRLRLDFMLKHRRGTYTTILTEGRLNQYLHEIDEQGRELMEHTLSLLVKERGITEELKATDPLRWVQEMNALKAAAEEIVFREIVYQ